MPKKVTVTVTTTWSCSLCKEETDVEGKTTAYKLHTPGGVVLAYDICEACRLGEPFASFVEAGLNERVAGPTAAKGEADKEQCEYCDKSYKAGGGMAMHQAKMHNVESEHARKTRERANRDQRAQALMFEVGADGPGFQCPECPYSSSSTRGLGTHRWKKHGVIGAKRSPREQAS